MSTAPRTRRLLALVTAAAVALTASGCAASAKPDASASGARGGTLRIAALEDHFRGTLSTLYGIQADVSRLKDRADRIEHRLGLKDTEH